MDNPATVEPYEKVAVRSRLLTQEQLDGALAEVREKTGSEEISTDQLSQHLLSRALVTPWQDAKLRQGLYQGFFLGKYKLLRPLGGGGMAKVYLAEHVQMHRPVALKILPPALVENSSYLARFYQESRATAALDHPNIVRAYDIDHEGSLHYLVMEFVEGEELQKIVENSGVLAEDEAADYIRQAAEGLAHAHERGMIHRDIKPGNLLVDAFGVVKVLDMGVARISSQTDEESLTLAYNEDVIGTVDYLAPEQVLDSHNVDARADIYSLGCTFYYLLTGRPPFPDGTMAVRLLKHQTQEPTPLQELRDDLSDDLVAIVNKMMAKRPEKRYPSAMAVSAALRRWLDAQTGGRAPETEEGEAGPTSQSEKETVLGTNTDTQALLERLRNEGILTPYQLEVLAGKTTHPLSVESYQILEQIQSGRLAGLYRARHRELHFPVCLQLLRPSGSDDEKQQQIDFFQREARIATQVNHANVVRTYQVGQSGSTYFITYEDLTGESLYEMLSSGAPLTLLEVVRLMRDAAQGLAHLHEQEIVHRNINPNNMWVTESRRLKLFDFSLACDSLSHLDSPDFDQRAASGKEFLGTPAYLAPEQAMDPTSATPASDLYSLGCTMYHALTGQVPFQAEKAAKQMLMHAAEQVVPPSQINSRIPQPLDQLVVRLMAKLPTARPHSAVMVAELLDKLIAAATRRK